MSLVGGRCGVGDNSRPCHCCGWYMAIDPSRTEWFSPTEEDMK